MIRKFLYAVFGLFIGASVGWFVVYLAPNSLSVPLLTAPKKETIGFLPYWLLDKAQVDYSKYVTTLAYFGVTVHQDGSIVKISDASETEPGWLALKNGKAEPFLQKAKDNQVKLSLVAFNGDGESIDRLLDDPEKHARKFVKEIGPILKKYGFTDLNLDIEDVKVEASPEAQLRFTRFVKGVRAGITDPKITLSIDVTTNAFMRHNTIDPKGIEPYVDHIIIMTYDYHYAGSYVTGPVAPLGGGGTISELDTATVIRQAATIVPPEKIIIGVPLYGYEWESVGDSPRAAVVPGSGLAASSARVKALLDSCATCSARLDEEAQEQYIVYKDEASGTYHQIFYPNEASLQKKIELMRQTKVGGLALWALGYEDNLILTPLGSR